MSAQILAASASASAKAGLGGVATAGATANAGWIAAGVSLVGFIVSRLFGQRQPILELAQPLEVIVMNPITIKEPPLTRPLLGSSGTIFGPNIEDLITRGGVVNSS